ncbi:MAG: hypothetical protein AAGU75_00120 [Bacillota bacterium]
MKVCFVVKVIKNNITVGAYAREVELPFIPTVGMKFKQGTSTWLWETKEGVEFPSVKEVVYNFDQETAYCLFEVSGYLASSFWTKIDNLGDSLELYQFEVNS